MMIIGLKEIFKQYLDASCNENEIKNMISEIKDNIQTHRSEVETAHDENSRIL